MGCHMLATILGISGSFNIIKFILNLMLLVLLLMIVTVNADWRLWDQLSPESTTYVILSYPQALEKFPLTISIL